MESAGDVVAMVVSLVASILALIASAVGIVKANHAKEMVTMRVDARQTSTQTTDATVDGQTTVVIKNQSPNIGQTTEQEEAANE